jgi:hypothetical protein
MISRKRLGIALGLPFCLDHRLSPTGRATAGRAPLHARARSLPKDVEIVVTFARGCAVGLAALFGFEDEHVALVAIDAAETLRAVAIVLKHAAFEHIIIVGVINLAAIGCIDT